VNLTRCEMGNRQLMPQSEPATVLELRDVSIELGGKPILNHLSIEFWAGHVHAVVGPNGAGKSTMANVIMGLAGYTHHTGDVLLDGEPINHLSVDQRARRGITLAWQEPARFEGLRVRSFLRAAARVKSEERLRFALEQVDLSPDKYLDRAVDSTLSGGERKRIELASILVMEPKVVLMDEPDSGIDVEALQRIFDAMRLFREQGATVITITHSQAVLEQTEHAFLFCCGQLVNKGSVEKISRYFGQRCQACEDVSLEHIAMEEVQG